MVRKRSETSLLRLVLTTQAAQRFEPQFRAYRRDGRDFSLLGRFIVGSWLIVAMLLFQPTIGGVAVWRWPLLLFPHVSFSRPRLIDAPRFLVQVLWLLFVKASASNDRAPKPAYRFSNLRAHRYLFHALGWLRLSVRRLLRLAWRRVPDAQEAANQPIELGAVEIVLMVVVVVLAALCITVPFSLAAQAAFVVALLGLAMLLRQMPGRFSVMLLMVLSLVVSTRYIWWRATSTLNWDEGLGLAFGLLLLMAEIYAWVVLVLGYFQNIWPLNRSPCPLPEDEAKWPTIDLFIPTYNEGLEVVRATVYAALGVDWPEDKLRIYILDDGKRDSFRDFAESLNIGYIRRPTNEHAKAGNINYALKHTDGEFVAIFDCDHIPTRAFFQVSMGWFLEDPTLALMQTPHHFYSPDPFERNLANFRKVPSEGNLFYGLVQDGNDLWNASFFCGSCAVIRRRPLEEVGGIAVETVTEDAHTSLRLHRRGYRSAYLRAPISAGLATETLSAHVGQRIRWARGMAQILRIDNPLRGRGLHWHQRLCYFNAMLHFLAGVPRLIFLTAPLVFLLLHVHVIYAPAMMILLYVFPHMFHSSVVNSLIQGRYRYSFWGEVYESVLAWYVARPTTVALFAPHKGKFNVTAKGGKVERDYYDWVISKPYIALVLVNVAGLVWGGYRFAASSGDERSAVVINMLWVVYNMMLLGAAAAVAREVKQVRSAPRVEVDIPATILLDSGHRIRGSLRDFSLGGLRISVDNISSLGGETRMQVLLERGGERFAFPVEKVFANAQMAGFRLDRLNNEQLINYVQCTFARGDLWVRWKDNYRADRPGMSFTQIFSAAIKGYQRMISMGPPPLPQLYRLGRRFSSGMVSLRPVPVQFSGVKT